MKRRSGLHKKVSSIFGDVTVPDNPPVQNQGIAGDSAVATEPRPAPKKHDDAQNIPGLRGSGAESHNKQTINNDVSPFRQVVQAPARSADIFDEDEEFRASQKKKLMMVVALAVVFAAVMYFLYFKPAAGTKPIDQPGESTPTTRSQVSEIVWSQPDAWPEGTRDPMVYKAGQASLHAVEGTMDGPALRGIVHKPQGRSSVLLGTEILYEGEQYEGWTVKEIFKDSVKLEKADGEKLELKMKDR